MNSVSEARLHLFLATVAFVLNATLAATFPTTPTLTSVPTTPHGCEYQGRHYPPGAIIERSWNRCYGTLCDWTGQIKHFDGINQCIQLYLLSTLTTLTTTTPFTRTPTTTPTPPTTKHPGCLYNGKHYQPGTTIEHGLCYTVICSSNSEILHGDDFNCIYSTLPPSTTPPTTTEPTARPQQIVG